jgi:lipopolysaccharide export system permease protein
VAVRSDAATLSSTLDPRWALDRQVAPEAVPFWRLPSVIAQTEQAGFSSVGLPHAFPAALGDPADLRRHGHSGRRLLASTAPAGRSGPAGGGRRAARLLFFFFSQLCGALGKADIIPAFLAAWVPPVLAVLVGFTLLFNTEDG